jgi:hypothetical protein
MHIIEFLNQTRRDFRALFECEHCKYIVTLNGYDDGYFHQKVIPEMKCEKCGKCAGEDYIGLETRYPDGQQL